MTAAADPSHPVARWALRLRARARRLWQAARSAWQGLRRQDARAAPALPLPDLRAAPLPTSARHSASVVIPALNEAACIAQVVTHALADPATAEVVVVDDSSIDSTVALARSAGARVVTSAMLGKGASMKDGVEAAHSEFVVFLDGDLTGLRAGLVETLVRPLVEGRADFVKARFGRSGGRVTELTAKPMLKVFFPELAHLGQPLGGIIAARRDLLRQLPFELGWGVDIGLVIDASQRGARVLEVDIGRIEHDSQPLTDLAAMANEVARVIFSRARDAGRLHIAQITAMYEEQRQAGAAVASVLARRRTQDRLLLLDMDCLGPQDFVLALAQQIGQGEAVQRLLGSGRDTGEGGGHGGTRSQQIARLLRFVHRRQFEQVATTLVLHPGLVELVNRLRRAGFFVGVIGDGCFVAADILRRRVFADFALAHTLQFRDEVCTGELHLNPAFFDPAEAAGGGRPCKRHLLAHLNGPDAVIRSGPFNAVWAIGSDADALPLLRRADRAFTIAPRSAQLRQQPDVHEFFDYRVLLRQLAQEGVLGDDRRPPTAAQGAGNAAHGTQGTQDTHGAR